MYVSVVHFESQGEVTGRVVSDGMPLKSARKYCFDNKSVVLRVFETDGCLTLKVTRSALAGEVLFEGTVPDGQPMHINDASGSFWVITISKNEIVVDHTDQGAWFDENGQLRLSERCGDYEGEPKIPLEEYLPTPEREEPAARDSRGIDGRDIRFLTCCDGGFFEGDSNIEVWYAPNVGCYRVRFWHDHSHPISRRKARVINPPDSVSIEEMNSLITRLLDLGLADTYSYYRNKDVLDGGSWHLTIGTRDGYCWSWGGYSAYPKGWDAARDAICELFLGFPSKVPYDRHTSYIADWHGPDGDRGRTDIAHLYRHGVALGDAQKWRIPAICAAIRQDALLYRRTRKNGFECRSLSDNLYAEVLADAKNGRLYRRTTGELIGAIAYIVDHDDAKQRYMKRLARSGTLEKLLCNVRIRDKAAPGFAVSGWDV